jgi:hypothetical protein
MKINLLVFGSLAAVILYFIFPDLLPSLSQNQNLTSFIISVLGSFFTVWVYELIATADKNKRYEYLVNESRTFKRTSISELDEKGNYVHKDIGIGEKITLTQNGKTFEGQITYHPGMRARVTLELDAENVHVGKGIYKYINRNDLGVYDLIVEPELKNKIFIKYTNKISSNLPDSEKVEGIEIWERV